MQKNNNELFTTMPVAKAENEGQLADIPLEVKEKMTTYPMNAEYAEEALLITIPQFFYKVPRSLFIHGEFALLERAQLAKDFTLKGKAYANKPFFGDNSAFSLMYSTSS